MLKRILTIGMGGTISAQNPDNTWESGEINQETLLKYLPFKRIKANVRSATLFRIDSSDIKPVHWMTLVQYISYHISHFDAVIVTHGTNTLPYTTAALSFLIQKPGIPIVVTGGMTPLQAPGSDSPINLEDSFRVAVENNPKEVCAVFNHKIFRGTRIQKKLGAEFDAFEAPDQPLGTAGHEIAVYKQPEFKARKRTIYYDLDPNVQLFKITPSFDPEQIHWAIQNGCHGIILEGYGVGKIPVTNDALLAAIKEAIRHDIPVCITTNCALPPNWTSVFEKEMPQALLRIGMIPCVDMTPETTLVKLMWALAQTRDPSKIRAIMTTNYVGEKTNLRV